MYYSAKRMKKFLLIITCFVCFFMNINISGCSAVEITEKNVLSNFTKHDTEFVFLYPRTFLSGKNETVCTVLETKYFPARIKIDMKIKNKHFFHLETIYSEAECFNLTVPVFRSLEVASADLFIQVITSTGTVSEKSYESALIYPGTDVIFMETDRQIYRQGDNVKIRILKLNQDMVPNNNNVSNVKTQKGAPNYDVKIINPQGFTVIAYTNLTSKLGIIHVEYQLANETTLLGTWTIECKSYRKTFLVKNYNLPKFKIYINAPKTIYVKTSQFSFRVCAKYTFGSALHGNAFAKITYPQDINFSLSKLQQLDFDGCTQFTFHNNELSVSLSQNKSQQINVFVTVTEDGTNKLETEIFHIGIQHKPYELKLLTEAAYYQPGLPYKNKLKIIRGFLTDYSQEHAEICYQVAWKNEWNLKPPECMSFQFDKEGVIPFSMLPFKENVKEVKITAKSMNHTKVTANALMLRRWYSYSANYLRIERNSKLYTKCKSPQQFTVYFTTNKLKHNDLINFYYLITTSNDIVLLKQYQHTVHKNFINFQSEIGNTIGTYNKYTKMDNYVDRFIIKFKTHEKVYSKGQLMVFYMNKGETISNSMNIYVEKCLPINVTAKWSPSTINPAEYGKLIIKAAPEARCAISSVDTANYFLDSNKRLNVNKILQPFLVRREFKMNKPNCAFSSTPITDVLLQSGNSKTFNYSTSFDTFEDFNNAGISIISNTHIVMKPCKQHEELLVSPYYQIVTDDDQDATSNVIRSYFPATWHWDLVDTDHSGSIIYKTKTPDTITTWNTNVLCTSSEGIGVTNVKLVTTKTFFVDFLTPHSMKRYEIFHLEVAAHNYFNFSLPIQLVVTTTKLQQIDSEQLQSVICISPNEVATKSIRFRATTLGKAKISVTGKYAYNLKDCSASHVSSFATTNVFDIVDKTIQVECEGYPEVTSKSILMCGLDDAFHNFTWNFDEPDNYVQGSESVSVLLYSDLMGPVLHHLEDLIVLPTGCGEQIMAVMAPNFYVLKYLRSIDNLLPYLRKRIFKNLQIGYQKILDYLHSDGSFSAFGYHDETGSMFLTSFVLRSLTAASEFIFIDKRLINDSLEWILKHQLENGCFASVSHVFQDMGGASMENSTSALTSYVMISLLESKQNISEQVRLNAVYCIRGQFNPDAYSLAINTYALYLLGAEVEADRGVLLLLESANKVDNFMWWNCTRDSKSMNIETTSYALMSLTRKISNDNLVFANAVVRWLLSQRNAHGGFVSSQDTVVALDAIARYATIMNDRQPDMKILISNGNKTHQTTFKRTESLKKEQFTFGQESSSIDLSIKGTGCILTQFLLRYNKYSPKNNEAFELNIQPSSKAINCSVTTLEPCFKYKNNENHPTMIVMEIFIPSGYDSEKTSLYSIVGTQRNLKKIEEFADKVVFYFTDLADETICLPFNISRRMMVSELFNSSILLYEYYNPDRQIIKTYNLPNNCIRNLSPDEEQVNYNNKTQ